MKEGYITPTMQVINCRWEDVITNSNETPFVPFSMNGSDEIPPIGQ